MKDEITRVAIEEFVGLKANIYSYLVDNISWHKKTEGVKKMLLRQ